MAPEEAAVATIDKRAAKSALVAGTSEEHVARDGAETRKQQIARRLKVSERVLEQYFQSKQAEVEEEGSVEFAPERSERSRAREKRV